MDDPTETEPEPIEDDDSLRRLIRDEIESVLQTIPTDRTRTDDRTDRDDSEEPLTLRAMEESVRRIVENAMEPLRAAQKTPKPKPAPRKEPEPEPEPAPIEVRDARKRLSSFLWGSE